MSGQTTIDNDDGKDTFGRPLMDDVDFFLFGPPRIEQQGQPLKLTRRKALALVMYLAMVDQPQSRDTLLALFWPDLDQERARGALRSTLPDLTALLPPGTLLADRMTIGLRSDAVWIDAREFLSRLARTRSHGHAADVTCERCVPLLHEAVSLYQGDFLEGFTLNDSAEYDEWQLLQREWLRRELANALKRLAHYSTEQRDFDSALAYAQRWLSLDALHEAPRRLLMRLYTAAGQKAEALRQYEEGVRLLDEQLSTPPEDETTRLYETIKASSGVPDQAVTPTLERFTGALPLLPSLIVGREATLRDLKQRLGLLPGSQREPVLVIQGWPGSGKSTTIAALAHDPAVAAAFPDGILWASIGPQPSLLGELAAWAETLNLIDVEHSHNLSEISAHLRGALRDKRMLLILDDIWQPQHATPFKVGGHGCAVVITTRFNDVAQALAASSTGVYKLPLLTPDQSLLLLRMLAPEAVEEHRVEAQELVNDLEGLPLALQVAGRLLHSEGQLGWGLGDLLSELRQGASLLDAEVPPDMVGLRESTTPTIATLLKRSTDSLDPETKARFAYLGFFVPKPATFDLKAMAAAWNVIDPKPTVRILTNRGLVEPVGGGRFQMHALLVMHARLMVSAAAT